MDSALAGAFLQQVADDGEPGVGRVRLLGLEPHRRAVRPARAVAIVESPRGVPAQSSGRGALAHLPVGRPRTGSQEDRAAGKCWSYHATRAAIGQALAFWLMSAIRISLLTAFSVM